MDIEKARWRAAAWGSAGVVLWLMLFSAGALINSRGYRDVLDPPSLKHTGDPATRQATQPVGWAKVVTNIVPAALLYTPTNAAILCALAGLIGGCASNLSVRREHFQAMLSGAAYDCLGAGPEHRRLTYLTESPFISMFRGFIVYLAFMAGVLIVVDDPFKDPTGATYLRYVGTVSLIAFSVGYDPTRFEDLVKRIPSISLPGQSLPTRERTEGTTTAVVGISMDKAGGKQVVAAVSDQPAVAPGKRPHAPPHGVEDGE